MGLPSQDDVWRSAQKIMLRHDIEYLEFIRDSLGTVENHGYAVVMLGGKPFSWEEIQSEWEAALLRAFTLAEAEDE